MPIFEYACKKCNKQFEALVRNGQEVNCPACQSDELVKRFSAFAVVNNGPQLAAPCRAGETCSGCEVGEGGGRCPLT